MSAFSQSEVVLCPFASCPVVTYLSVTSDSTVCGRIRAGVVTCAQTGTRKHVLLGNTPSTVCVQSRAAACMCECD